jgi:hypothetical protein
MVNTLCDAVCFGRSSGWSRLWFAMARRARRFCSRLTGARWISPRADGVRFSIGYHPDLDVIL